MNTGGRTLEKLLAVPGLSASAINHLSIAPYAQANWIAGAPVKVGLGGKRKAADKRATKIAAAACYTAIVPKKALHYAADTLCRDAAIQAARNILGFLEVRTTSKAPFEHAKKLVRSAFSNQGGPLVDEIFCQLYRTTVGNDDVQLLYRVWRLFSLVAGCFDPSSELAPYLAACAEAAAKHMYKAATDGESTQAKCAVSAALTWRLLTERAAALAADRTTLARRRDALEQDPPASEPLSALARSAMPADLEIAAALAGGAMRVRVFASDAVSCTASIDQLTSVAQLCASAHVMLGAIPAGSTDGYARSRLHGFQLWRVWRGTYDAGVAVKKLRKAAGDVRSLTSRLDGRSSVADIIAQWQAISTDGDGNVIRGRSWRFELRPTAHVAIDADAPRWVAKGLIDSFAASFKTAMATPAYKWARPPAAAAKLLQAKADAVAGLADDQARGSIVAHLSDLAARTNDAFLSTAQAWQYLGANVFLGDEAGAAVQVRERSPGAGAVLGLASSMYAKSGVTQQLALCIHSKGLSLLGATGLAAHAKIVLPPHSTLAAHAKARSLEVLRTLPFATLKRWRALSLAQLDARGTAATRARVAAVELKIAEDAARIKFTIVSVAPAAIALRRAADYPGTKTQYAVRPGQIVHASHRVVGKIKGQVVNFFHVVAPPGDRLSGVHGMDGWVFDSVDGTTELFHEVDLTFANVSGVALGLRASPHWPAEKTGHKISNSDTFKVVRRVTKVVDGLTMTSVHPFAPKSFRLLC